MEKGHNMHFAHITVNGLVDVIYVFDPETIDNVYDEFSAQQYLSAVSGKPTDTFVNCFNGERVKGVYPEVGYRYIKEEDVFSE